MNSRDRIQAIVSNQQCDRSGFWLGNPHEEAWRQYIDWFGLTDQEQIREFLGDDFRHVCPEKTCWKHPEGKPVFDWTPPGGCRPAPMAEFDSMAQVDDFYWPDTRYLDFSIVIEQLRSLGTVYRACGMASGFYSHTQHAFGMANYFVKLRTEPGIVERVTSHIAEFFLNANEELFRQSGELIDGVFVFNDFGTQTDLQMDPVMFENHVIPWLELFVAQAHKYGYHAIIHSCGSIIKVIDRLIDIGVDVIHPIQAKAANMDAKALAKRFYGKVVFMGGIDTQDLLINGRPEQVAREVMRVRRLLGPNVIISPSHEVLLPDVPAQNVYAMARAATAA